MARNLLESAGAAASASVSGHVQPWLAVLCMVVASALVVSLAVFICGHSSRVNDDLPRRKPRTTSTRARSSARSSGTVVDTTGMYGAAYGGAAVGGCSVGHGGHGGGGGGGGGGCGGGGGGGGCGGGGGGCGGGGGGGC